MLPITLLVITRNEQKNIARCLSSVPFAAEKIVIDSGSTDQTCAVAESCGARVVQQEWLGFGPQRNFGTTQAAHEWILFLDADEELSLELIAECEQRLPEIMASERAGVVLRRSAECMGKAMRWYRPMIGEVLGRIYHKNRARWSDSMVHELLSFEGATETFKYPFIHYHSPTLIHKHQKILTYSEIWARNRYKKQRSHAVWTIPLLFPWVFTKNYILRCAFLDGWRGCIVAYVAAYYACYKRLRLYEIYQNPHSIEDADDVLPPSVRATQE